MATHAPQLRSLYRSLLRELPARPLSTPSPLQQRLRAQIAGEEGTASSPSATATSAAEAALQHAQQYLAFVRAQRTYTALLERYNPGMGMNEEERVRLTMRRVGLAAPATSTREEGEST